MDHERTSHPPMAHSSGGEHPVPQPEHTHVITPVVSDNNGTSEHGSGSPHSGSTVERRLFSPSMVHFTEYADLERGPVFPPSTARRGYSGYARRSSRRPTSDSLAPGFPTTAHHPNPSHLEHVVPSATHQPLSGQGWTEDRMEWTAQSQNLVEKKEERNEERFSWLPPCFKRDKKVKIAEIQWFDGTIGYRLAPTIKYAEEEKVKYAQKALALGWAVNVAIALQVLLGALTTALAAAVTNVRQAQISTTILGGLSTLVASYLARVRGSGEPELSVVRVKDLEHFLRDCRAFELDHGHQYGADHRHCPLNKRVIELRQKFEDLLGNANGERKLSATGITSAGAAQTGTLPSRT